MEQEHDLTQGSLVRTVVVFAIPFLLANLIQAFYGAADLMVVGWYCGRDAVAAVSTGTQVTQIITSMITGLTGRKLYWAETAGGGKENHWNQLLSLCRSRGGAFGFAVFVLSVDPHSASNARRGL